MPHRLEEGERLFLAIMLLYSRLYAPLSNQVSGHVFQDHGFEELTIACCPCMEGCGDNQTGNSKG